MNYLLLKNKFVFLLVIALTSCALPPEDITRQNFVPEHELYSLRLVSEAVQQMNRGRNLSGEMLLLKAQALTPDSEKIRLNIGVSLYGQERYEEAYEYFSRLNSQDPLNPSYRLWLAKSLIGAGAVASAENLLYQGISILEERFQANELKNYAPIYFRTLANSYYRLGDFEQALCASQIAFTYANSSSEYLKHLKLLLLTQRLSSAKFFILKPIVGGLSGLLEYQVRKAELEYLLGDIQSAKTTLQSILTLPVGDALLAYEVKLLTLAVGRELQKQGQQVDIKLLSDTSVINDLLADPRRNASVLDWVFDQQVQSSHSG